MYFGRKYIPMDNLYHVAPPEEIFNEVKKQSILLWRSYSDEHGYASGKIARIDTLENIRDNFMFMVAMFDISNQRLLANVLSPEARTAIRERLIEGGASKEYIVF